MSIGFTKSSLLFFTLVGAAIFQNVQKRAEETPKRPNETRQAPTIPRTWDDEAIASLEIPLTDPTASPVHMKSDQYYGLPIRPIYRSYPVYAPNNEPKGYLESLAQREPEISFDASQLKTPADWIRAGETVFEAPIGYDILPCPRGSAKSRLLCKDCDPCGQGWDRAVLSSCHSEERKSGVGEVLVWQLPYPGHG